MSEKSAAVELFGEKTLNQTIEISKTNPEKKSSLHMRLQDEMARNTYSDATPAAEKIEQLKAKDQLLGESEIEERFKN